jgi:hypothetical protein
MKSGEWWYYDNGMNMLKGVEGDPTNPPLLSDEDIVQFLSLIPEARDSFNRLVPNMLPEEQTRLIALTEGMAQYVALDWQYINDNFQHTLNTQSVRTCGPRGGGSWAPPQLNGGRDHA